MNAGDTFLTPDFDDHLWVIVSDPAIDPKRLVVVCFLSWREHYDQACVLHAGDHPFVRHDTCVHYPAATLVDDATLEALRTSGKLRPKAPLSADVLERIRKGAERGDIPTECYEVLREQGFVE